MLLTLIDLPYSGQYLVEQPLYSKCSDAVVVVTPVDLPYSGQYLGSNLSIVIAVMQYR